MLQIVYRKVGDMPGLHGHGVQRAVCAGRAVAGGVVGAGIEQASRDEGLRPAPDRHHVTAEGSR